MIVKLKKFLFVGVHEDLDLFFEHAQQQGFIEFLSISGKKAIEMPGSVHTLMAAMKILRKQPVKPPYQAGGDVELALKFSERILELKADVEKLEENKRFLEAEISRVEPFGEFSMDDVRFIEEESGRKIQFFCMKTAKSHKTNFTNEVIYISTVYDLDYFITINAEARSYPGMVEMRIEHSANELHEQLSIIEEKLHVAEAELKSFAGHLDFLHWAFIEELNDYNLRKAKNEASHPFQDAIFAIEAWVPKNKVHALFSLVAGMAIHCEEIAIEQQERVPTCMQNRGLNKIGEDLVKIYDIPAADDKDPSGWVFWSFLVFFAMIVSDGGYGLLFLAIALFLKFKMPKIKADGRRFLKLSLFLAVSCIAWGLVSASFFGIEMKPDSPIAKFSLFRYLAEKKAGYHLRQKDDVYQHWVKEYPALTNAKTGAEFLWGAKKTEEGKTTYEMRDQFFENTVMELSLMLGVIHLTLSFLRYLWRNWAGLGWIIFMIGGYLYFPSMLNATSMVHYLGWVAKEPGHIFGLQLIYGGIGAAILFALVQKRLKGIGEIANVVQVFADVLSYLRLYALGLAGSIMAATFNDVGAAVGFAAGVFVILLGHGVNILLGTMSGVIHGLRLNFIEWYHYSFEGGGRLFNPLMKHKLK